MDLLQLEILLSPWLPVNYVQMNSFCLYINYPHCISIGLQRTPLHWAAERGHAEIIPLLNDASAQLEAKDKEGVSTCMSSDSGMS